MKGIYWGIINIADLFIKPFELPDNLGNIMGLEKENIFIKSQ